MAIEVFNRYENKYLLTTEKLELLKPELEKHMRPDKFNLSGELYTICNVYYDTADSHLIRNSLMKPKYKEKLRLRSYGTVDGDSQVFIEIKKKFRGIVNKRRSALKLSEATKFLETGELPEIKEYMNAQVLSEIKYLLSRNKLIPSVFLSYRRYALFESDNKDLRISFDTDICSRKYDLNLTSGIYGKMLLPEDTWIMEIKVSRNLPIWLVKLLSQQCIYPVSFSKYGKVHLKTIKEKNTITDSSVLTNDAEELLAYS